MYTRKAKQSKAAVRERRGFACLHNTHTYARHTHTQDAHTHARKTHTQDTDTHTHTHTYARHTHKPYTHTHRVNTHTHLVVVERSPLVGDGLHAAVECDGELKHVVTPELVDRTALCVCVFGCLFV